MNQVEPADLEEIGRQLVPLLRKQGLQVENVHAIGLIGRGASSSVFSLMVNGEYHVLKLYYSHTSYLREQRNRRRLIWPPRLVLASPGTRNSLGYDLVITKVPPGTSLNSNFLLEWVQEKLGRHLAELHRLRRSRRVTVSSLRQALADTESGALKAGEMYGPTGREIVAALFSEVRTWLNKSGGIMRVQTSILHNDLWWDNIIVAQDEVYLIDWESMRVGDYAEDLAFGRVMIDYHPAQYQRGKFWRTPRDVGVANRFWAGIVESHIREFSDDSLPERLRFYLVLQTLRRLSDLAYSSLPVDEDLLAIWIEELPGFWSHGLVLSALDEPAMPAETDSIT